MNAYLYARANPIMYLDARGLAERQSRPLDIVGLRNFMSGPLRHDRFLYEDGSDSGFYGDGLVREDRASQGLIDRYRTTSTLDDDILREAEERVRPLWDRGINPNAPEYSIIFGRQCHDYADAVEEVYRRILRERTQD